MTGEPAQAVFVFLMVWGSLKAFSKYSGLMVNHKKSAILLKGHWTESLKVQLLSTGLQFQDSYKYLRIGFGHVTPEVAYSHALQKAMGRAFAMQSWDLSLAERVLLLKLSQRPAALPLGQAWVVTQGLPAAWGRICH